MTKTMLWDNQSLNTTEVFYSIVRKGGDQSYVNYNKEGIYKLSQIGTSSKIMFKFEKLFTLE